MGCTDPRERTGNDGLVLGAAGDHTETTGSPRPTRDGRYEEMIHQQARVFDEASDLLPGAHADYTARVAVDADALLRISRNAS